MVDAILRLSGCRNVQTYDVASLVQFFCRVEWSNVGCYHCLIGAVSVVRIDLHAETLCNTSHVSSYVSEGMNTEFLAQQFCAARAVIEVTYGINHQA